MSQEIILYPHSCLHNASIHSPAETAAQTQGANFQIGVSFLFALRCGMALHLNPSQRKKLCSREGISAFEWEEEYVSSNSCWLLGTSVSNLRSSISLNAFTLRVRQPNPALNRINSNNITHKCGEKEFKTSFGATDEKP